MWEKVKQAPWKKIIPVAVLIITLALNIWLWCMPVFKGSAYNGSTKQWAYEIKFYDVTYSGVYTHRVSTATTSKGEVSLYGFYVVDEKDIYLTNNWGDSNGTRSTVFNRRNVFTITIEVYSGYENQIMYCNNFGAIFLQIFYIILFLISGVKIIKILITEIKEKRNRDWQRKDREQN